MSERLSLDSIKALDRSNYDTLDKSIRKIIISKLSYLTDIHEYLDDLVCNAFIVLLNSVERYSPEKSSFSTYSYRRIIASSKKLYFSLKYPYSGIKALMGKTSKEQEKFLTSSLAYLVSIDELETDITEDITVEDTTCI